MPVSKEKIFPGKIAAWLAVVLILLAAMAIGTPTAPAIPTHRDCTSQNRAGENAVLAAKYGIQSAGYLNRYGWSAYIGKSDAPSARQNRIATGLSLCTYVPEVSYTAYPAQYGQNFIPNIRPATSHFGRDPRVRLQPSTVYDGSTRYDGTSGFSLAAETTTNAVGALEDWSNVDYEARYAARDNAWETDNAINIHGNSANSPRTAYLYRLETRSGQFLKWGITQNPATRYSKAFMADKYIYEFARGGRADMLQMERGLVETQPGPLNFEPWAGSRLGGQP